MATAAGNLLEKVPEDFVPEKVPENFVTLTVRLIRSFEQRNIKFLVLKLVDLDWTTEKLIEKTFEEIQKCSTLPKPFRTFQYDTMKVRMFFTNCSVFQFPNTNMNMC